MNIYNKYNLPNRNKSCIFIRIASYNQQQTAHVLKQNIHFSKFTKCSSQFNLLRMAENLLRIGYHYYVITIESLLTQSTSLWTILSISIIASGGHKKVMYSQYINFLGCYTVKLATIFCWSENTRKTIYKINYLHFLNHFL